MKIIKITKCSECPYFQKGVRPLDRQKEWMMCGKTGKDITNKGNHIHKWCPLK